MNSAIEGLPRTPDRDKWVERAPIGRAAGVGRGISLLELLLGAGIVVGHNVFHVIPNEVPILFALGLLSIRVRNGSWTAMGLTWPTSWARTVLIALAAAAARILLSAFLVDPLTAHFWPPAIAPSGSQEIHGHLLIALQWLGLVWTFAAFGEEISYRGYLLNRTAEAIGSSRLGDWAAVFISAVLFGYGHYYKGPSGIIDSAMAGLVLGCAYLLSKRNLWVCVLAHGFIDTFGIVAVFLGWQT